MYCPACGHEIRKAALRVDVAGGNIVTDGRFIHLQPQELTMFLALLGKRGKTVTMAALSVLFWEDEQDWKEPNDADNIIKQRAGSLNTKLEGTKYSLENIRGRGYRLLVKDLRRKQ